MTTQEDRWPSICCILACQSATSSALCASTTRFGFDLALHPGQAPEQPAFLHFGFQMPAAGAVRELLARMEADRVPVPEALGGAGLRRVQMPGPGRLAGGGRLGADRLSPATTAVGAWCA